MYLKSIKAYGFKSFADKIDLEIKNGITGVVGPNGSGKSNIVDAIRWVLGEQSVKQLRGNDGMQDIIFNGSKSRGASNRCYVSLTFDNKDHYLNTEFSEVEIKRILYRNGDNEYLINNSKVRLKDITDLFLDTFSSKESFNIISQGNVTDVVNSKPPDRRVIFEEAAGVLKYKKRKLDTLKKLEKSNINLEKIELLINELKQQVEPLEEQSKIAKRYLELKKNLEETEISMIAKDMSIIYDNYQELEKEQKNLKEDIEKIDLSNNTDVSTLEKMKLSKIKYDEELSIKNDKLINLEKELAEADAKKKLSTERKKYEVDDMKLENNIVVLEENKLNINKNITTLLKSIDNLNKEYKDKIKIKNKLDDDILSLTNKHYKEEGKINLKNKEILEITNKINILENNIEQNSSMPYSVKQILNNPRLKVHGTISKLIDIDEKYVNAINITLGANNNVIVVDSDKVAKECINYLKDNKYGRATFFPLDIIKERNIDEDTLNIVKKNKGFIDIAINLIKYDATYNNILGNQLGNVIVVDNIDTMNKIAKDINYKYRVVTLDGEIIFPGGAITGGNIKKEESLLSQKQELTKLKEELDNLNSEASRVAKEFNITIKEENELNDKLKGLQSEILSLEENINNKNITLNEYKKNLKDIDDEISGTKNLKNNKIDDELKEILDNYYKLSTDKDLLVIEIDNLKKNIGDITLKISEFEEKNRVINSEYNKKLSDLKDIEIKLGKLDVKIDNYLNILNDNYNLTFDKAKEIADLNIDLSDAKSKVSLLKKEIISLGEVNTGSISEYERVSERYNFLVEQQADLKESIDELLKIIDDMDDIMVTKFSETFKKISLEFEKVFKLLFKGGEGKLILTDPDNILETGIDIIAEPPGKKLNSIALLSGGEKTLTAISLLFAILNVRPAPFVVLDEVEAALDDANVTTFGKYLKEKALKSQFIVITHKKKTMEYADILYGITMQEQGVSKLVSVKIED